MIKRWGTRIAIAALALIAILIAGVVGLAATESGTRWLLARAQPYLPQALSIERATGTLLSGMDFEQVAWRDAGAKVEIEKLSISAKLRLLLRRHLAVEVLHAQGVNVVLHRRATDDSPEKPLSVDIPLRISVGKARLDNISVQTADRTIRLDSVEVAGSVTGAAVDVSELVVKSDWLQLEGQAGGRLQPPYRANVSLNWSLAGPPSASLAGQLRFDGDSREYRLQHTLSSPFTVDSEGILRAENGEWVADITSQWQALAWPLEQNRQLTSRQGMLRLTGRAEHYAVDGDIRIQFDSWPEFRVLIDGQGGLDRFDLASLSLQSSMANLYATGAASWRGETRWNADFEVANVRLDALRAELNGLLNAAGAVSGRWPAGTTPEIRMQLDDLSGTVNGHPVDGAMSMSIQDEAIEFADAWAEVGSNRIEGHGRVGPDIDLMLKWDTPALDELPVDTTGRSRGELHLQRAESAWLVSGTAAATDLSWRDYAVGAVSLDGAVSTTGNSDASLDIGDLRIDDITIDSARLQFVGVPGEHSIDVSLRSSDRQLSALATGNYTGKQWIGQIQAVRIADGDRSEWSSSAPAGLRLSATAAGLQTLCLVESMTAGRLCAAGAFDEQGTIRVNSTLEKLPLARISPMLLSDDIGADGIVAAEIDAEWRDSELNGSATIRVQDAVLSANYAGDTLTAALQRSVAQIEVSNNELNANAELLLTAGGGARAQIGIADITDRLSGIDGEASLELTDLSFVPLLIPAVSETRGTISGTVSVGGSIAEPVLGGDLRLADGALRASYAGVYVSDISLRLRQSAAGQLALSGSANSGDGRITVSGNSRFDPDTGLDTSIDISGDNFEFIRLPEWHAVASPDITVTLDTEAARIRGSIAVPQATITLESLPETAERVSQDAIVHGREELRAPATRRFDVDVEATLGDTVRFSGFGLDTRLSGALRLRGGSQNPYIGTGRIGLHDGSYKAYGQELDIESGTLLFAGPLANPALDIRATRQVNEVLAGLTLSGTPADLRSTVFSEPPLSDAEALSYLIAGRPLVATNDDQSQRVGQAALALGVTGADKVIAQIQSKLGLDSLSLDSGDDVGRITAGRRIGGRLLVEYGYGLVDRLGTLLLRYQLNDRIVVESTTGSASTLDVVYSVKKD